MKYHLIDFLAKNSDLKSNKVINIVCHRRDILAVSWLFKIIYSYATFILFGKKYQSSVCRQKVRCFAIKSIIFNEPCSNFKHFSFAISHIFLQF